MDTAACSHKVTQTNQCNANNYQLQTSYIHAPECSSAGIVSVLENTHKLTRSNAEVIMCQWVYFNIWVPLQCFSIKDSVNTNFCPPAMQSKNGNDNRKKKKKKKMDRSIQQLCSRCLCECRTWRGSWAAHARFQSWRTINYSAPKSDQGIVHPCRLLQSFTYHLNRFSPFCFAPEDLVSPLCSIATTAPPPATLSASTICTRQQV